MKRSVPKTDAIQICYLIYPLIVLFLFSCGIKAYLGLHGPSIKLHPDMHGDIKSSDDCLECHDPADPSAPPTQHKDLGGCLKCHNDELENPVAHYRLISPDLTSSRLTRRL